MAQEEHRDLKQLREVVSSSSTGESARKPRRNVAASTLVGGVDGFGTLVVGKDRSGTLVLSGDAEQDSIAQSQRSVNHDVEDGEQQVIAMVMSARGDGMTSNQVLTLLGMERDSVEGKQVMKILSFRSARGMSRRGKPDPQKPLVRMLSKAGQVTYIHGNHFFIPRLRACFLCGGQLDEWQVLGGSYGGGSKVAVFRKALSLCMCEACFRTAILGTTGTIENVGFAVLPHDFLSKPNKVAKQQAKFLARVASSPVVFDEDSNNLSFLSQTREKVRVQTIKAVKNFGSKGGTWHDIIEKVRQGILPQVVQNLKDIVQWSLHISSSKTLKSSKPLLRRAMVGFDGCVQILFVSKEFIDPQASPNSDSAGRSELACGISLEIAEQVVAGAIFGLRPYTLFRVVVEDRRKDKPEIAKENQKGQEDKVNYEILRRYSDFVWLRDELVIWHGDEAMIPPLPRKRFVGRFNESFLEARMHALEHFLAIVATHPVLHRAEALQSFFKRAPLDQIKAEYEENARQRSLKRRDRRSSHGLAPKSPIGAGRIVDVAAKNLGQKVSMHPSSGGSTSSSSSSSSSPSTTTGASPAQNGSMDNSISMLASLFSGSIRTKLEPLLLDVGRTKSSGDVRVILAPDFQRSLRKCYKRIDSISSSLVQSATLMEDRAKSLKFLAGADIPEVKSFALQSSRGGAAGLESSQADEKQTTKGFSNVPLQEVGLPTPYSSLAFVELLSMLSRLDVLGGTANRATCIRMNGIRLQMKEWHRSLQEFSYWFENRAHTVRMLEKSISVKRAQLSEKPILDDKHMDDLIEVEEESIRAMDELVDRTRQDASLEAKWLLARNKQELLEMMTDFAHIQIEHSRQMCRMWQDFLPQLLVSLEQKYPINESKPKKKQSEATTLLRKMTTNDDSIYSSIALRESGDDDSFLEVKNSGSVMMHDVEGAESWEIDPADIVLGECIGRGSFGEVHTAVYHGRRVAVKTFHTADMSDRTLRDFRNEALVMRGLPPHPNLISFYGMCSKPDNVCLIMELVESGSMLELLLGRHNKQTRQGGEWNQENVQLNHQKKQQMQALEKYDPKWRLTLALGAAKGIQVLHNSKPLILHRDIKTSNLLVSLPSLTVKVCDFGLARFKLEHQSVKSFVGTASWVAPEVIVSRQDGYSTKADVYSFAIVLWQIYARAQPYPKLHATQVLFQVARENLRPTMPKDAPKPIQDLIKRCWDHDPAKRPNFDEIVDTLSKLNK